MQATATLVLSSVLFLWTLTMSAMSVDAAVVDSSPTDHDCEYYDLNVSHVLIAAVTARMSSVHTIPAFHVCTEPKAPFTRYNRLSNRLSNRFDNRLYRVYKHSTGCQTGLTSGLTTGWMFVYTIQPVFKPVVQPV